MAKMSIPILVDWESIKDYLAKSDIVEVVRCKDCKYGEVDDEDFPDQYLCHSTGYTWNKSDFFCADGERKEE